MLNIIQSVNYPNFYSKKDKECIREIIGKKDNDNCECTEETICQSFENTAGEITDNEYEVNSDKEEEE